MDDESKLDKGPGVVGYWVSINGLKHVALYEATTCGIAFSDADPPPPAERDQPTCPNCMAWYEAQDSD